MALRALYELYGRLESDPDYLVAPTGRSYQKITFVVVIERNGRLVNIEDARLPGGRRPEPRRVLVLGVTKPSGPGFNPCFLWDAPGYLLGWDPRPERMERAIKTFAAFRNRHLKVEDEVDSLEYSAVCRFLEGWNPERTSEFPSLEDLATGFGVFQIRGETGYVHDVPAIVEWWSGRNQGDPNRMRAWWKTPQEAYGHELTGQCLVTGVQATIARLHPKIKGVVGAQPSGATIAGFNDSAYWSYGLEQSYNAPVSVEAARCYTTALNTLLDGPRRDKHRLIVGGTTVAFWTDRASDVEDVFALFAGEGSTVVEAVQDEKVRAKLEAFLRALRQGREAYPELGTAPDSTSFFVLVLAAPTPARIAMRFFHRGTLTQFLDRLRRHHQDIGIERRFGTGSRRPEPELPTVLMLLNETKQPGSDVPPLLPAAFLESIVTGFPYPEALFTAVMRRIAKDRIVNYPRACLIKGHLVRNLGKEVPVSLDTTRTDPAYRLGRLFAALEKTQADALGGTLSGTIRDRFYSAASATPAAVFPRLLRTYQHHLAKLEGGLKVNREKLVREILEPLESFPTHIGLAEQGLFALGYYHQTNDFYRSKSERT